MYITFTCLYENKKDQEFSKYIEKDSLQSEFKFYLYSNDFSKI